MPRALPDDLVKFIRVQVGSVSALQLMLTLMARPEHAWSEEALVREMRASDLLIAGLLDRFQRIGLAEKRDDAWHWRPATKEYDAVSKRVAEAHAVTPFAVLQVIVDAPGLMQFAEAFRLRKD